MVGKIPLSNNHVRLDFSAATESFKSIFSELWLDKQQEYYQNLEIKGKETGKPKAEMDIFNCYTEEIKREQ